MRILYDFQNMIGGAPRSQLAHMMLVKSQGCEVMATIGADIDTLQQLAGDVHIFQISNFSYKTPLRNILIILKWLRLISRAAPDVIHSNRSTQSVFLSVVSDITGVPLVFAQAGGVAAPTMIKIVRDKIGIAYSLENKRTFLEAGMSMDNIHLISNRITLHSNTPERKLQAKPNTPLRILLVGNIKKDTIQGVRYFLEVLRRRSACCEVPFIVNIAGGFLKVDEDSVRKQIDDVAIEIKGIGRINLLGWVDNIEEQQISSDVCIGKGRSVIQAAMYGTICFVLSEQGNLTRVTTDTFDLLYEYNFSGRGKQQDTTKDFLAMLASLKVYEDYQKDALEVQQRVRAEYLTELAFPKLIRAYNDAIEKSNLCKKSSTRVIRGIIRTIRIYLMFLRYQLLKMR